MKRTILSLSLVLALSFAGVQAQQKSIVGLWDFTQRETGVILEFTENQAGEYGSEGNKDDYTIVGDKIIIRGVATDFKLQGNKLTIKDSKNKLIAKRIIPTQSKTPIQGVFLCSQIDEYLYCNIQPDGNAEFGDLLTAEPMKYLTVEGKIYFIDNRGRYLSFNIKDDKTFQIEYKKKKEKIVFNKISNEEFQQIRANYEKEKGYAYFIYRYLTYGNYEKGIEYAQKAIAEDPEDEYALNALCVVYNQLNEYEKSIEILNKMLQINPQDVIALGNLSYACLFVKDYEKAEQCARTALSIDSTQLWIKGNLATAILFQDRYEEAKPIFRELRNEQCFESDGRSCAEAWLQDFNELEEAGVIPESQTENIEKLRTMLNDNYPPALTKKENKITEVVKTWIDEIIKAEDVNRLMQISDVPFAANGKVITTSEDLQEMYLEMFQKIGKRTIPAYNVQIWDYTSEVIDGSFPVNYAKVEVRNEYIYSNFSVSVRDNTFKIAGFADVDVLEEEIAADSVVAEAVFEVEKTISILNGEVELEVSNSSIDFPCIGLSFADHKLSISMMTCMEIKRRGEFYQTSKDGKKYATINEAIEDELKRHFEEFYKERDKKRGKKLWEAFVKEGGLQQVIDFANEVIDNDFLDSPFNEIYG